MIISVQGGSEIKSPETRQKLRFSTFSAETLYFMLTIPSLEFADAGTYECTSMVSKSGFVDGPSLSDTASNSGNLTVNGDVLKLFQYMDYLISLSFKLLLGNRLYWHLFQSGMNG